MKKSREQLIKEYEGAMQLFLYIHSFMECWGNEDSPYKNYEDLAKEHADGYAEFGEKGILEYWQTITDLQVMAEKEMDSWERIKQEANTWMPDAAATKKWLENDVIPVLVTEAERRGWKKPA